MNIRLQKRVKTPSDSSFTPVPTGFLKQRSSADRVSPHKHDTPDLQTQLDRASRFGHNFSRVKVDANSPAVIQTKLTIGKPGDKYEQEADKVASQVMTMPVPTGQQQIQRQAIGEEEEQVQAKPLAASITPAIQLQTVEQEEEQVQTKSLSASLNPDIQRQTMEEEEEQVQTKSQGAASDRSFGASDSLQNRLTGQKGGGNSLSNEVRTFMEPRFGVDFSSVRVHTDSEAVQMNRELNAQAFTHGSDIYFGAGKYNPGSGDGKHLLAHELTHVVQQNQLNRASEQVFKKTQDDSVEVGAPSKKKLNKLQEPAEAKTPNSSSKEGEEADNPENAAKQNNSPRFGIKRSQDFLQSLDGKSIDSKLFQTIEAFCKHLILNNYVSGDILLTEGMRDVKKSHRWSTAYAIRNDKIPLEALQNLPNGRDADGNQWYEKGEKIEKTKSRAADLGLSSPSNIAAEGYPAGDPRRIPNIWDRGISNHLIGKAIDLSIPWTTEKGGQLNDPVANELIKKFGLKRPVPKDNCQFELLQGSEQGEEEYGHAKES